MYLWVAVLKVWSKPQLPCYVNNSPGKCMVRSSVSFSSGERTGQDFSWPGTWSFRFEDVIVCVVLFSVLVRARETRFVFALKCLGLDNRFPALMEWLLLRYCKNSENYRSDVIHKITHSNPTPFQTYTLPILHSSKLTFFQIHRFCKICLSEEKFTKINNKETKWPSQHQSQHLNTSTLLNTSTSQHLNITN